MFTTQRNWRRVTSLLVQKPKHRWNDFHSNDLVKYSSSGPLAGFGQQELRRAGLLQAELQGLNQHSPFLCDGHDEGSAGVTQEKVIFKRASATLIIVTIDNSIFDTDLRYVQAVQFFCCSTLYFFYQVSEEPSRAGVSYHQSTSSQCLGRVAKL
ncbi:hypothetical protein L7F22_000828 [Adiantum nelumboides]|nr:hypothetical protein [Adiantum nelumboides]